MRLVNANPEPDEECAPRLSIIIPTLDEATNIGPLLESLRAGAGHRLELIVADGGSADATVAIAERTADRVIAAERGRARQMNAGAMCATGDILLFLHADVRLPHDYHALLTEHFWGSDCQWGRFDVRLSGTHLLLRVVERLMNWRSRLTRIATGDQAIFVRRGQFGKVDGYDDIPLMEDVALSARLRRESRPYCIGAPVIVSSRKWEREGVLRTIGLMWYLRFAYWMGRTPAALAERYYGSASSAAVSDAQARILLFCRAPEAGSVKTRLIPALGEHGAADLHARLVRRTVETVLDARLAPLAIWVTPDPAHPFFDPWREAPELELCTQADGDLGRIMFEAADDSLANAQSVVLIGSDCPALTARHLSAVLARLEEGDDAVVIPAEDGGYVLLGLSKSHPRLFEAIDWGTPRVCETTRERLRELGWRWSELEPLWDVDRPEDLERLQELGLSARAEAPGPAR